MRPEPLLRFSPFQHSTHVYSVGELALHIGGVLDADAVLKDVWLRGEVVNVSRSPAGHHYFALKDQDAQLRCVLFRGSAFNSPIMPANGLALVAHGAVHLYERQGSCELVADLLFPEGVGVAQMQGERLYRQLESEGLFEPSRKRPLPRLPRRIGIVSSERGAVIHDLLSVLERRFPLAEVIFLPTPVQGPGAAAAIAHAVGRLGDGGATAAGSTSWSSRGAGVRTKTWPRSTTSAWCAQSLPVRRPWSRRWAMRRTSPCLTWWPIFGRQRRPRLQSCSRPTLPRCATTSVHCNDARSTR